MSDEWPKRVRTSMQPDVGIEVGEVEYIDLQRQGLLADDGTPHATPLRARDARQDEQDRSAE